MRRFLVPAAAAVLLATSSMSFAATSSTTGTVKAYDAKAMTLTLQDGTVFHLPKHFKDPGIKVGEKVSVSWTMVKKLHDASAVKIVN